MATRKKTPQRAISTDPVGFYAQEVVSGKIIAGPHVRGACARHLRDLETGEKRGLYFDKESAQRAIGFYRDVLRLNGGEFEGLPFELLLWQMFIVGSLFGWKSADGFRRFRVAYVETGKGSGKSPLAAGVGLYGLTADGEARAEVYAAAPLALDTPVPTVDGWKTQGDLKVGDKVFAPNGLPCTVTYLSPVLHGKECFEVEFDDGTVIVSDAAHRWQTEDTRGQKPGLYKKAVVTTAEIAKTLRAPTGRLRHRIEVAESLELPDASLPIDPYTLGVWLGDGKSNRGAICFHRDDQEHIREIESAGYVVSKMGDQGDTRYGTILGLRTHLRGLGLLDNKHVPAVYLRASRSQRLALLQGLMDTDGTCSKTGECRFTNREHRLASAVHEIAIGLGLRASIHSIQVTGFAHWIVSFKAPQSIPVFKLTRKLSRQVSKVDTRAKARYVRDVRPCKSVPVRCIEVDSPDHLYLVTRSNIATHNTKKDQAMVLYRDAVAMWQQSPALKQRLTSSGTGQNIWNLAFLSTGGFFRPISADDGQSGPRPHIALIDEIHEHRNNMVVEMMRAGTKSRRQALIFMITNSGSNKTGPCWQYHDYSAKVCAGLLEDDGFFGYVAGLDEKDDPFRDETCWAKVNPSLQGANLPGIKYLREQVTEARGMPSKEALVRRLNFCQWTDAANPWISADVWLDAQREFDWRDLRGRRAWGGLDLSSTTDLTGLVLLVEPETEGDPWHLVPFCWLPDEGLDQKEKTDRVPYRAWKSGGYLDTTPGKAISKLAIVKKLVEISRFFDLQAVAFDRWRIEDLKSMADDNDIDLPNMTPFGQGYKDMSPAIEAFETELLNGRVIHPGNPVFTWCAANAVTTSDDAENRKLSKEKATGRIDLIVAAVMAVGCHAGTAKTGTSSFFESFK